VRLSFKGILGLFLPEFNLSCGLDEAGIRAYLEWIKGRRPMQKLL
jgi:hypothetical protein